MTTAHKPFHRQSPQRQRSVTSADHSMTFYLDDKNRLLINAFPLDNVTTLALANMLHVFYADIAQSAKPHNGIKEAGRKSDSLDEEIARVKVVMSLS